MRFQVPQFIEIEDKIVGPLSLKQFLYLAGGAGMSFVAYRMLPLFIYIIVIPALIAFSLALAFYKYNNKPFIDLVDAGIKYYLGEKLYIWKKREHVIEQKTKDPTPTPQMYVPRLSDSKLKELTWSLDIKENENPVTKDQK
jgi:hypothetical protein